jgi:2-polyprenyl-6-methoxyphenol hydroxylase-like FAD-dependent oxidoreductase
MGPMSSRVSPIAGRGYLLVGDAAGFLDPFTGEGIYRAVRGGHIAARVIRTALSCDDGFDAPPDLTAYVALRRSEFRSKEALTWMIQLGLANPAVFDYLCGNVRRHERERLLLGAVLGDFAPAGAMFRPDRLAALFLPW